MQTQLRSLTNDAARLERLMKEKLIEYDRAKAKAKLAEEAGNKNMSDQYILEAALISRELTTLSESRARVMSMKSELVTQIARMRDEAMISRVTSSIAKSNKHGNRRTEVVGKAISDAETQMTNISTSHATTSEFFDKRVASQDTQDAVNKVRQQLDAENAFDDDMQAGSSSANDASAVKKTTNDLQERLEKLKSAN